MISSCAKLTTILFCFIIILSAVKPSDAQYEFTEETPQEEISDEEYFARRKLVLVDEHEKDIYFTAFLIYFSNITEYFNNTSKNIHIFALDTIYIDADITVDKGQYLSMIAPICNVVNYSKIKLIGKNGEKLSKISLKRGFYFNGQHGNAGYPSGNFIGVCQKINNIDLLEIITQGGNGTNGENGKNGLSGRNGTFPNKNLVIQETAYFSEGCIANYRRSLSQHILSFKCDEYPYDTTFYVATVANYVSHYSNCRFYGRQGTNGNMGGNGGKAGPAGLPGNIFINNGNVRTNKYNGTMGKHGRGGRGGRAGTNYGILKYKQEHRKILTLIPPFYIYRYCYTLYSNETIYYYDGLDGLDGEQLDDIYTRIVRPKPINIQPVFDMYKRKAFVEIQKNNTKFLRDFLLFVVDIENDVRDKKYNLER